MPGKTELELDQLWFTWSTAGLGSMPMGFRVRAASDGLYDTLGMRYRRVNRFLNYELPEGASISEFNNRIAPISLSFVHNNDERLLIRKVFTGLDGVGRNGAFFTHLIAGLPREFTAREAIEFWHCPELWAESEQGLLPHETTLEKIPYSRVLTYIQNSQTSFNFAPISEKLQNLLLLILSRGLPSRINVRGHSTLIASLIYGLTHTLPMKLLPNLTFTTYESDTRESEALIAGTINGVELQDITRLQVQPEQATGPISEDIQRYVSVAVNSLVNTKTEKLYKLIDEIDGREHASVDDLIELFKLRFRFGKLSLKQLESIVLYPAKNVDELLDPTFQMEAAQLLLNNPDYWEPHGKEIFQKIQRQTQDVLARCLNGMAEYVFLAIREELSHGSISRQNTSVLDVLAYPSTNPNIYQRMLIEFAQEPLYRQVTSDGLWPFHHWLLSCARLMQPLPTREEMLPWLSIPSWDKLDRVLKLNLPTSWEYQAMFEPVMSKRGIPKSAMVIIKAYEAKFTAFMRDNLKQGSQSGNQNFISMGLRLFESIIRHDEQANKNNEQEYSYPNRVVLLLTLLSAVPTDPGVIESLFLRVQFASPYQLSIKEFGSVVAGILPEVMAARSASPSLMTYIQEFILSLTPKHLMYPNTLTLLEQFQQSNALTASSDSIARSVNSWLAIHKFLTSRVLNEDLLQNIKPALGYLIPQLQQRGQDTWHTFIKEMAPHLVALVETEPDLQTVLNVFEGARVVSSWDLLNALAACAGETLAEDLYRLIPYLLCGIRGHARAGLPKEALDAYLQTLFSRAHDNTLNDVNNATSIRIWPELINAEWKGWRDRRKTSWLDNLPGRGKKNNAQQQKPPTGLRLSQPSPNLATPMVPQTIAQEQAPNPAPLAALQTAPKQQMPNQASPVWSPTDQQQSIKPSTTQRPGKTPVVELQILVTIGGLAYPIQISNYVLQNHIWLYILQYWTRVLSARLNKAYSKGITSELYTTSLLQDELKRLPATTISEALVEYFVDNMLIKFEIERICKVQDQPFLHAENYVVGELEDFKVFVEFNNYQNLSKIYTEQTIKEVFSVLIRRYQLIQHMEGQKRDWNKWLDKEKKSIKYGYQKAQVWM